MEKGQEALEKLVKDSLANKELSNLITTNPQPNMSTNGNPQSNINPPPPDEDIGVIEVQCK
jgi:hypothetical protein